jgi:hypothetical protein
MVPLGHTNVEIWELEHIKDSVRLKIGQTLVSLLVDMASVFRSMKLLLLALCLLLLTNRSIQVDQYDYDYANELDSKGQSVDSSTSSEQPDRQFLLTNPLDTLALPLTYLVSQVVFGTYFLVKFVFCAAFPRCKYYSTVLVTDYVTSTSTLTSVISTTTISTKPATTTTIPGGRRKRSFKHDEEGFEGLWNLKKN